MSRARSIAFSVLVLALSSCRGSRVPDDAATTVISLQEIDCSECGTGSAAALEKQTGVYAALAAATAFLMVGHRSVYASQKIGVSKSAALEMELGGAIGDLDLTTLRIRKGSLTDRFRHLGRLSDIQWLRPAMGNGAVRARTSADFAHQHEGGSSMAPTLGEVRTQRLLANGVQAKLTHDRACLGILAAPVSADFDPIGMAPDDTHSPTVVISR